MWFATLCVLCPFITILYAKRRILNLTSSFYLLNGRWGEASFPRGVFQQLRKKASLPRALCSVFKVLKDTSTYIWIIHTQLSMFLQPCNPLGLYLSLCSLSNCLLPSVKHIQNCYLQVHVCYKISDWLSITRFTQPCSSFQSFQCGCDTWHP